jgi:hypothetical protein
MFLLFLAPVAKNIETEKCVAIKDFRMADISGATTSKGTDVRSLAVRK